MTYLKVGSNLATYAFLWAKFENSGLFRNFCSFETWFIKVCKYCRSRLFLDLDPMSFMYDY